MLRLQRAHDRGQLLRVAEVAEAIEYEAPALQRGSVVFCAFPHRQLHVFARYEAPELPRHKVPFVKVVQVHLELVFHRRPVAAVLRQRHFVPYPRIYPSRAQQMIVNGGEDKAVLLAEAPHAVRVAVVQQAVQRLHHVHITPGESRHFVLVLRPRLHVLQPLLELQSVLEPVVEGHAVAAALRFNKLCDLGEILGVHEVLLDEYAALVARPHVADPPRGLFCQQRLWAQRVPPIVLHAMLDLVEAVIRRAHELVYGPGLEIRHAMQRLTQGIYAGVGPPYSRSGEVAVMRGKPHSGTGTLLIILVSHLSLWRPSPTSHGGLSVGVDLLFVQAVPAFFALCVVPHGTEPLAPVVYVTDAVTLHVEWRQDVVVGVGPADVVLLVSSRQGHELVGPIDGPDWQHAPGKFVDLRQ
ncbi:uncharacterized protein BcabD6B2_47590 [Babesia caballi]|uniref:Uncharacterized protein n=1 Tax=Babesia caballi TaxID=5871 RepID=A0AAV4M3C0_BABCB|nr:hypothetical protein BcabD6B2_47590 [Babesia caballi]